MCSARGHPCEAHPLPESVWSRSNPSHRWKSVGGGFGYPWGHTPRPGCATDPPWVHLLGAEQCLLKTSGFGQQDGCFPSKSLVGMGESNRSSSWHTLNDFLSTTRSPEHPVPSACSSAGIISTPASPAGQPRLFGEKSAFPDFIYCFV